MLSVKNIPKKGLLPASFIVAAVIVLISFVIISGVLTQFAAKGDDVAQENLCRGSIQTRANTMISLKEEWTGTSAELRVTPPLCSTIDKKITHDRVQDVAEEMAYLASRCWWMFGEGRYEEILDAGQIDTLYGLAGTDQADNGCFLCYAVHMDNRKFKDAAAVEQFDMRWAFIEKEHRKLANWTYIDYIQHYGGPGKVVVVPEKLEPGKSYGVSFLAKNKELTYTETVGNWFGALSEIQQLSIIGPLNILFGGPSAAECIIREDLGAGAYGGASTTAGCEIAEVFFDDLRLLYDSAERQNSAIIIDTLDNAQERCFNGDIQGK